MFSNLKLVSRLEKPVLRPRRKCDWDAYDVHSNHVIYDSHRKHYRIYYNNTTKVDAHHQGAIGMALSEDGLTDFTHSFTPLLRGGKQNAWDRWLWKCRVLQLNVRDWRMWYGGVARKGYFFKDKAVSVGYATSGDGWHWKKYGGNPIVASNDDLIYDFTPIYDGEKFSALYYSGRQRCIFLMRSRDGVEWKLERDFPVLKPLPSSWEAESVSPKCLLKLGDVFVLAYEAGVTGKYCIGLAYSEDLVHWQRDKRNPILTPRPNCFDSKYVADPSLIVNGDELRIYYGAKDEKGEGTVGLAIFKT